MWPPPLARLAQVAGGTGRGRPQALLAVLVFGAALLLAAHHPLAPAAAMLLVGAAAWGAWRWPGAWLFAIPAALPWLNFSPWTGWLIVDEFDLWVLALLAGAYAREAWTPAATAAALPADRWGSWLVWCTGLSGLLGLGVGLVDAAPLHWGWFAAYEDPLNSVRVAKSLLYAALLWPLLRREVAACAPRAARLLGAGMVVGLVVVVVASVWERMAYTRLFDFGRVYRTTALFWEMHVGGGAIDAYLALAMPFGIWALHRAKGWTGRVAAMVLLPWLLYACASTFSRGVYGAVLVCITVLGLAWWRGQHIAGLRARELPMGASTSSRLGWYVLPLLLAVLLGTAVLEPRSFMSFRWAQTFEGLDGRWNHWRSGIAILQTPAQWGLGRGLGRIPAHLQSDSAALVSGRVTWQPQVAGGGYVVLQGPAVNPDLSGLFALTQRVALLPSRRYVLELEVRAPGATVLLAELCERHLLYDRRCQGSWMHLPHTAGGWHTLHLPLHGAAFAATPWMPPRLGMLALSVPDVGGRVDIRAVRLQAAERTGLVANGNFQDGMAHWFAAAQFHFLPWHLDSLYLETLVERGAAGLLLLWATLGLAAWRVWNAAARPMVPYLAASLAGVAFVGTVSSVMDVPRVATLFWLLLLYTLCAARGTQVGEGPCAQ